MNPDEYRVMAEVEQRHWWYQGARELCEILLQSPRFQLPERPAVLDAGCGTGQNLVMLNELLSPGYLAGFDIAEDAVTKAAQRVPEADVYRSDLCSPGTHRETFDLLFSSDVLYTTGIAAAMPGLRMLVGQLCSGGLFLLHLPAFNWLYSRHDMAVHTVQRFRKSEVRSLLEDLGLHCELLTYRMCLLFPLVVLQRLPFIVGRRRMMERTRGGAGTHQNVTSDLAMPSKWLNSLLHSVVRLENRLIRLGMPMPAGSSLIAIGRKP
ncbi:MAG: methyltransferase domain-containing protein [Planctomycetaceae bacterium]|nr:methyltransferase domain-containing protein [Planctomycetaceae bacterium]